MFGCDGCALTTTGHPAASADAESPPATENASGKFEAAKIETTPNGCWDLRRSGLATGRKFGSARSIIGNRWPPVFTNSAKARIWITVRITSPVTRAIGSAVS